MLPTTAISPTHHSSSSPLSIGAPAFLVPPRIDEAELLDEGAGSLADIRINLTEIWRINQAFAGLRSLLRPLKQRLQQITTPVHIVDLGTGGGQLALHLSHWAQRRQQVLRISALDLSARHLSVAQEHLTPQDAVHLVQADGLALPFAPHSVDYFISSLFLHHFSPDVLITLLRDAYRLSRRGIIMNDIVRGYLPLAAFHITQPIFARHFLTYHDGVVSIKRAYRPEELLTMARAAGLESARVESHFPWRMTLIADKADV